MLPDCCAVNYDYGSGSSLLKSAKRKKKSSYYYSIYKVHGNIQLLRRRRILNLKNVLNYSLINYTSMVFVYHVHNKGSSSVKLNCKSRVPHPLSLTSSLNNGKIVSLYQNTIETSRNSFFAIGVNNQYPV